MSGKVTSRNLVVAAALLAVATTVAVWIFQPGRPAGLADDPADPALSNGEITTLIRSADWIVGWDEVTGSHIFINDADLAFTGRTITFVGKRYDGKPDRIVDGRGLMVMPGLVNLHAHPSEDTDTKGIGENGYDATLEGELAFFESLTGDFDDGAPSVFQIFDGTDELRALAAEIGYSELLLNGVTTVIDISENDPYDGWVELLARSGLRAFVAPMVPSFSSDDDVARQLDRALAVIDRAVAHESGRLGGVVLTADSSLDAGTLKRIHAAAVERGVPFKIHGAQSLVEYGDAMEKHGMTPIAFLDQIGVLGPETIIAHATIFDHHPNLRNAPPFRDIDIVAKSSASVAHAPYGFALSGVAMHGFARYRRAGINVGIGTDTFGHNMLEEMRLALLLSRLTSRRVEGATVGDVFDAATVGGARALWRDDIGRLRRGARADLVLVSLDHPQMTPVNDPLRSLVLQAGDRAVRDVYVDGRQVVANGRVLTLDHLGASRKLESLMQKIRRNADEPDTALPVRLSQQRATTRLVGRREVLHGRIADVPYERAQPPVPGLSERAVVPYGLSASLDVAVVRSAPGLMVDITIPWHTDWLFLGVSGQGRIDSGGRRIEVAPGDLVLMPRGSTYNVVNDGDSDWEWLSIHPHDEAQYLAEDDGLWEGVDITGGAVGTDPVVASLRRISFGQAEVWGDMVVRQIARTRDFDLSLRRLPGGGKTTAAPPLQNDLYLQGIKGTTTVIVGGTEMHMSTDEYVFLPQGTVHSLVNREDGNSEFIWLAGLASKVPSD